MAEYLDWVSSQTAPIPESMVEYGSALKDFGANLGNATDEETRSRLATRLAVQLVELESVAQSIREYEGVPAEAEALHAMLLDLSDRLDTVVEGTIEIFRDPEGAAAQAVSEEVGAIGALLDDIEAERARLQQQHSG